VDRQHAVVPLVLAAVAVVVFVVAWALVPGDAAAPDSVGNLDAREASASGASSARAPVGSATPGDAASSLPPDKLPTTEIVSDATSHPGAPRVLLTADDALDTIVDLITEEYGERVGTMPDGKARDRAMDAVYDLLKNSEDHAYIMEFVVEHASEFPEYALWTGSLMVRAGLMQQNQVTLANGRTIPLEIGTRVVGTYRTRGPLSEADEQRVTRLRA